MLMIFLTLTMTFVICWLLRRIPNHLDSAQTVSPMILGFAHPALVVPDLSAAVQFYESMFGFRTIGEEGWRDSEIADRAVGLRGSASRGAMLAGHNCFLELFEFDAPTASGPEPATLGANEQGIRHLSFYVDDVKAEYERMLTLGGLPLGEPVELADGICVVYGRDPFGNIIELCNCAADSEDLRALPGVDSLADFEA